MGWLEWIIEHTRGVVERVETGLREFLGLPEEIAPVIPSRPATREQIEEAMSEAVYAERFIAEIVPDEARRLARGVTPYEKLTNVARMRHWTVQAPEDIAPSSKYQISQRLVIVGPDGQMTYTDIAFPTGEAYSRDEAIRRAAASLDDDFVAQYDVSRSDIVRLWTVVEETYIQRYKVL